MDIVTVLRARLGEVEESQGHAEQEISALSERVKELEWMLQRVINLCELEGKL
jgi:uncharacterized coiled-coil protein SlyX